MANWNSGYIDITGKIKDLVEFFKDAVEPQYNTNTPYVANAEYYKLDYDETHFSLDLNVQLYLKDSDRVFFESYKIDAMVTNRDTPTEITLTMITPWRLSVDDVFPIFSKYPKLTFNMSIDEDSDNDFYYFNHLIIENGKITYHEIEKEEREDKEF